ncbi:MAG: ATP-binding protein [Alphaproteobacteria bacterium]|nr:ATP-binding protein [Rhodospirillales bacterium]MCW9046034.1 ATP-binding protein [Alphaproteobacteria bacterium]
MSLKTQDIDLEAILGSISSIVIVIDETNQIRFVNAAAENFFAASSQYLQSKNLSAFIPLDHPLFGLVEQSRRERLNVSEYGITLDSPRTGQNYVNIQASRLGSSKTDVVLSITLRSFADKISRQLTHRGAARSVTALAGMLAHEVKNPLSGIRGAAQLVEQNATPEDQELTRLICTETDRICAIVDRLEVFSDQRPLEREPVNIHRVLEHVRKIATSGFGRKIRFTENYDPSLPPVYGNRDQLIQVFLNLIKNAVEANPKADGEIVLSTSYQHGVSFVVPGTNERIHLPLMVSIKDHGEGISEDIRSHLFEPFVTTKKSGSGLGLALVAKIINDHGGVIECDSQPSRTIFKVMLPVITDKQSIDLAEMA